jgi:hypothetical protein
MPIIAEDDSVRPVLPDRAVRRSAVPIDTRTASYNYNYSPYASRSPTTTIPTTSSNDGTAPNRKPEGDAEQRILDQEWIARRRAWYRTVLLAFLSIAVIVGLAVGLTLGLRKGYVSLPSSPTIPILAVINKPHSSSSTTSSKPLSTLFPAGNYSFTTALSSVSTSCTSAPLTWRCYPFVPFSPSTANASSAVFFWSITPKTSWSYTISSSSNPFAPSFSDLPLAIHDANQYAERLTFNFTLSHSSVVDGPLGTDTAATTCWFNSTVMAVTLWTRMRADFPAGIEGVGIPINGTGADGAYAAWPFRVQIRETQGSGADVPDCRHVDGGKVGGSAGGDGACGCFYGNFGLGWNGTVGAVNSTTKGDRGG